MRTIYLDGAATVPADPHALIEYMQATVDYEYNPSSIYKGGVKAKWALQEAREKIARVIRCKDDEIFFTSGGTEGNNMILRGFFDNINSKERSVLITSQIEHPSVLSVAEFIDSKYENAHVYYLPVDHKGYVDLKTLESTITEELHDEVNPKNILVSIQGINNEIGTMQNIDEIRSITKRYDVFYHCDAVQLFPHVRLKMTDTRFDAMSVSGHKFGAMRGTGFVYISEEMQQHLSPLLFGGGQEFGLRSGTEDVAAAVSLANQVDRHRKNIRPIWEYEGYVAYLSFELEANCIEYYFNSHSYSPILSLTIPGSSANNIVACLSELNIFVSAGSACHSYVNEPSHVLKAIGLSDEDAKSTIRICLSGVSDDDFKYFVSKLIFYINFLKE